MSAHSLRTILLYVCLLTLSICICAFLAFGNVLLAPNHIYGDAMNVHLIAKIFIDDGWWWWSSHLAYPFGAPFVAFPASGGQVDYLILWVTSFFTENPFLAVKLYFLWVTSIAAVTFALSLRVVRIPRSICFALAIVYVFLPHIFYRNVSHIMLTIYMIPPVCIFSIVAIQGRVYKCKKWTKRLLYCSIFYIGLQYIYTSIFTLFLLAIVLLVCFFNRKIVSYRPPLVAIILLCIAIGVNLLPTVMYYKTDPGTKEKLTNFKCVAEADIHAFRLRDLIQPIRKHPMILLRKFRESIDRAGFPLTYENSLSSLGFTASIGFLFLLLFLVIGTRKVTWFSYHVAPASKLNIALFLIGTMGGFGSLFNLISPQIRCYNRISPFLAFLGLYTVACMLAVFKKKVKYSKLGTIFFSLFLGSLPVLAIFDQYPKDATINPPVVDLKRAQSMVRHIEKNYPETKNIYYFPNLIYPSGPKIHKMPFQADSLLYLFSKKLNWSCNPLSYESERILGMLDSLTGASLVDALHRIGYQGVLIDTRAYPDNGISLLNSFSKLGDIQPIRSEDGVYIFLPITNLFDMTGEKPRDYLKSPVTLDMRDSNGEVKYIDWHGYENIGRWTRENSLIFLPLLPPGDEDIQLTFYGHPLVQGMELKLLAGWSGECFAEIALREGDHKYRVTLPRRLIVPNVQFLLELKVPEARRPIDLKINDDRRVLGCFIYNILIAPKTSGY